MLHGKLKKLFPDYKDGDWILVDEGNGPKIFRWNRQERQPTLEEINVISDLEIVKEERAALITISRNEALKKLTASWDNDTWDANEETSNRIANALSMVREAKELGIPTPPAIPWRTYDNKDRTLTIAELTQMGAAVFLAQQMVWAKQAQLKNAIDAARTEAEVLEIDW